MTTDILNNLKAINIADVATRLGLKPSGSPHGDRQMFHGPQGNGKTPSLSLDLRNGVFKNWAVNGASGSNIDLVMHVQNSDFNTAINWLCEAFRIEKTHQPVVSREKPPLHVYIAENCLKQASSDDRLIQYLLNRGISQSVINQAIKCKTIGFNTYTSPSKNPGEPFYGGPAVAFIVRSLNPGHVQAVDMRYLDPDLNGGMKTQCHGSKKGQFWTANYHAVKPAHTVIIVESCINALTVETAEIPGYVGISTQGVENATEINWGFLRGKRALICMDKDGKKGNGMFPGQQKSWELYNILCSLGISAFLIDQSSWTQQKSCQDVIDYLESHPDEEKQLLENIDNQSFLVANDRLEKLRHVICRYDIDLNDLAKQSITDVKTALERIDNYLIPGVPGKHNWGEKPRVYLPTIDQEDYWRFRTEPEHTTFLKTITVTTEENGSKEKIEEEVPEHVAGFRIANLTKVIVAGYVATLKGVHDDAPSTLYAVQVQTRKDGNQLVKKVFAEGLFNPKNWEDSFGPIYNQHHFKRALNIMENIANVNQHNAVNFVGLAWFNGHLKVNSGDTCYFPEPEQQCPYSSMKFHSGSVADAQKIISTFQDTFGRNAATMILTWILGTHLKLFTGYYPHMVVSADKGTGKSRLIEKLEVTTGIRKFSSDSLSEFRLRTATSGTSFPIAFDELSNTSMKKRSLLESRMQQCYSYDTTKTRTDMLEFIIITPVLVSGEDVDMRNVISKTVCASLKRDFRGEEINIHNLPKWPMLQWLTFLTTVNRNTFDQKLGECRTFCQRVASSKDSTSMRMMENYALVLLAWKLVCEFAQIAETQGDYINHLISEMNSHIQQTDADREPWMWVMEKISMELHKGTYPYPWQISQVKSEQQNYQCLLIKIRDIMDYINNSNDMREFRERLPISSGNALKAQLKNAGMIFKDPVHMRIMETGNRHMNCIAIPLFGLAQYGIFVPGADYDSDELLKDVAGL
jgi:hypothetical protein